MNKLKNLYITDNKHGKKKLSFWTSFFMLVSLVGILTFGLSFWFPDEQTPSSKAETQTEDKKTSEEGQQAATSPDEEKPTNNGTNANGTFFSRLFENKDLSSDLTKPGAWRVILTKVPMRLMLAALLAAMLAYRPQKFLITMPRNPYVAQTQILLAVVASALMIIVADSAARAFGIFAAASLVRFRTGIRDPKEVTVMLISLAIGLGTGVGHLALAVIFALFVLLLLWVLEYREPTQIFRTLELKIKTHDVDKTHERLKELFLTHQVIAEVQELKKKDKDDPRGKLVYRVHVHPDLSTDKMSEELFALDRDNVDSIEWQQKKSTSYFYK
jgi:uncharacterized protein YpmS